MTSKIVFGPIHAAQTKGESKIDFPVRTQGDWMGTSEGHEAVRSAKQSIEHAITNGTLPKQTVVKDENPDTIRVHIPCQGWAGIQETGAYVMEQMPRIIRASHTDLVPGQRP